MGRKGKHSQAQVAPEPAPSLDPSSHANHEAKGRSKATERALGAGGAGKMVSEVSTSATDVLAPTKTYADTQELRADSTENKEAEAEALAEVSRGPNPETGDGDGEGRGNGNGNGNGTLDRSRTASLEDMEEAFSPPWSGLSFSCGGWLQFYLFGVAKAFQVAGLDKDVRVMGTSAGALAAAGLAYGGDFDEAVLHCKEVCIPKAHERISGFFRLHQYVSWSLEKVLLPKWKPMPAGRLQIAITKFPSLEGIRVMEHRSANDLRDTLLSSAAAYPLSPIHEHKRFGLCIDGGLSDFQPLEDENTVTISPFYFSDCDIRPSRYVPPWWALVPPRNEDTVDWQYDLGFQDGLRFIRDREIAASTDATSHLAEPFLKKDHPFDTPRRLSMYRFLGYNYSGVRHNVVNFLMDLGLLVCFILFLKPAALLAIYIELILRMLGGIALLVASEVLCLSSPPLCAAFNVFPTGKKPAAVAFFERWLMSVTASRDKKATAVTDKLQCICSLSLLLRFLPGSLNTYSSVALRKHDKLYKHSYLYRVCRHVI